MTLRCTRAFGVVVGVFFAVGCTPDRPRRTPVDAILSGVECHVGVREALRSLGADETFLPAPPGPNGMRGAWIPTSTFGAWVALTLPDRGPPPLAVVTSDSIFEIRMRQDCTAEAPVRRSRTTSGQGFSFDDEYLHRQIAAAAPAPLVVYVWSPHMPLAPDGWPEIERAASDAGMRVVPALIAHGDRAFASREAHRVGMPDDGLREITSIELLARQAQVHAPSIVIFSRSRVSPVLPGYRTEEGYRRYLGAFHADPAE